MEKSNPISKYRRYSLRKISILLGCLVLTWFILGSILGLFAWKAVFLDTDQVYFGRGVWVPFASTFTLRDVYYLRDSVDKDEENAQTSFVVVSTESDVHGPEDKMKINKINIRYIQNLRSDSLLLQAIKQKKNNN